MPKDTVVVKPPVNDFAIAAGLGALLGLVGSAIELGFAVKRLGRGGKRRYQLNNVNWDKTSQVAYSASKVGGYLIAGIVGLTAAVAFPPLFLTICTAIFAVETARFFTALWQFFRTPREDQQTRQALAKTLLRTGVGALVSGLMFAITLAAVITPIGFAAAAAVCTTAIVIYFAYAVYSAVSSSLLRSSYSKTHVPRPEVVNPIEDQKQINHARMMRDRPKDKFDYYFAVNRAEVVNQITSFQAARTYLLEDIAVKIQALQAQNTPGTPQYSHQELEKRQDKITVLTNLSKFLTHFDRNAAQALVQQPVLPPVVMGGAQVPRMPLSTSPSFERLFGEYLKSIGQHGAYLKAKHLAGKSFFRAQSDVADIEKAVETFVDKCRHQQYVLDAPQQQQQQLHDGQPVFVPPIVPGGVPGDFN